MAIAYKHGFKSTVKSERGALETLRKEWQDLLVESRTIFDTASSQYKALEKKYMDQIEGQKNEFDKFKQSSESDFKTLVDGSTKELKNIERTYDQRLALRAAVQYWKRKATSHQRNARRLSWAASIVGIIVAIALAVEAAAIIDSSNTIGNLAIWKIAVFLLTCIPGIWAIRILVRLLLSNLHLNSDAVERRTMLLTYLALLRRGEGPSEDKKDLILNMLFRPCATGIVKDDALPSIAAKWLKIITG